MDDEPACITDEIPGRFVVLSVLDVRGSVVLCGVLPPASLVDPGPLPVIGASLGPDVDPMAAMEDELATVMGVEIQLLGTLQLTSIDVTGQI